MAVEAKIKEFGYSLCQKFLGKEWRTVSLANFKIEKVHGGLTNHLFVCSLPNNVKREPGTISKALLRLYGAFYSELSDTYMRMMEECIICAVLAEKKIGPDLYGVFPEGRLEQFLPDVRSLNSTEVRLPQISKQVARHVATFHKLTLPLAKEANWHFDSLERLIVEVKELKFNDPSKSSKLEEILNTFDLEEELKFLRLMAKKSDSPVLFSHNDVQPGNLLVNVSEPLDVAQIKVIDFEYSSYNYRGFDIGNHFCEWACDYNYPHYPYFAGDFNKYPSHAEKGLFVRSYLQSSYETEDISDEEVEKVIREADKFSLLSHYYWAIFSILQSYKSTIDFGYMEYATFRIECYQHFKYFAEEKADDDPSVKVNGKL